MASLQDRPIFFDNLRYLMILLVLVFHAGASYGALPAFWPYRDPNPVEFVTIVTMILDVFMMSVLFFISGYFALPSLRKAGGKRFLAGKFKRLGIPWLIVTIGVLPVLDYIHVYRRALEQGFSPRSYGAHWWASIQTIAQFHTGPMRMSEYLDMTQHFYQRYVWYLSLLLVFFLLFWLTHEAWKRWGGGAEGAAQETTASQRTVYGALAVVGLLNAALFGLVKFLLSSPAEPFDMAWRSLGNIVQFETAKLAFYVPYFGLGVYAYAKGWFADGGNLGRPWAWALACFGLMVANMLVGRTLTRADDPSLGLQLAFLALYPLWTLSFLVAWVAFASRRWTRATPLGRDLAAHSYQIYLVHYVFVMTLPLLLDRWTGGHTLAKFGIVALATITLSYGFSKYVLKPRPRLVVLGLAGLSILLAALT